MRLDKHDWHGYFERLSRSITESPAETEVAELPGDLTTDAPWVELVAVLYDPKRDVIEMVFELPDKTSENYTISAPQTVSVNPREHVLDMLEVIDRDGVTHRLRLAEPLEVT
jgi:hypothetical protein